MVLLCADFMFAQIVKIPQSQCGVFPKDAILIQLLLFSVVSSMDPGCKTYILLLSHLGEYYLEGRSRLLLVLVFCCNLFP